MITTIRQFCSAISDDRVIMALSGFAHCCYATMGYCIWQKKFLQAYSFLRSSTNVELNLILKVILHPLKHICTSPLRMELYYTYALMQIKAYTSCHAISARKFSRSECYCSEAVVNTGRVENS